MIGLLRRRLTTILLTMLAVSLLVFVVLELSPGSVATVVEFFFAYKGFDALLLEASLNQDLYVIEACTLVAVGVAVLTQTLADVGYAFLNPRLRWRAEP